MNNQQLFENIRRKGSFLCVGLDTDLNKIPSFLLDKADPIFAFNKEIIDATAPYTVAYKPNLAFYESEGVEGWHCLEMTVNYIRKTYPDIFLIADAKRGDIGNTSSMYAKAFFEKMDFDAVTVAPYMGEDSVKPFLAYEGRRVVLLALTSNKGALDFQFVHDDTTGEKLFERVLRVSKVWGRSEEHV
jgi:orotidine-5'-phosphate decarboxylase